ncbi:MAG: hypothetical protein AAF978_06010, partial [Cyanobacteria bacterium P01_E01_bin.48]
ENLTTAIAPLDDFIASSSTQATALAQQGEALSQLGPVVVDLQGQLENIGNQFESSSADNARTLGTLQTNIAELESRLETFTPGEAIDQNANEIARLRTQLDNLSGSTAQQGEALSQLGPVVLALQSQLENIGSQFEASIADRARSLDTLQTNVSDLESRLQTFAPSEAIDQNTDEIARLRDQIENLPDAAADIATLRTRLEETAQSHSETHQAIATLQSLLDTKASLDAIPNYADELAGLDEQLNTIATANAATVESTTDLRSQLAAIADWKAGFGDRLSPAEMLEALDFLGRTITQYDEKLSRKADPEAVKLNTESIVGLQELISDLQHQVQSPTEIDGQNAIEIATLTQQLATANQSSDRQAKELQTQAAEIARLNAQLAELQHQLAPEQLRQAIEREDWTPERAAKLAKHLQTLAQAQVNLRRWLLVAGITALGAVSLALSNFLGWSLG